MTDVLNRFIEEHPAGWDHDAWLGLLTQLENEGLDVTEPAAVGLRLERERVAWVLRRAEVPGLGPKRLEALVDRYPTLWGLRQASPADISEIKTIPAALASKISEALHGSN